MLNRVKIQGYKSLEDVEVHLQPLSMLFGANASGKSNFLDALQLLSRTATSENLRSAFALPHRGTPLESFTFGPKGVRDLLDRERISFTIEIDIHLSQSTIDTVIQQIQEIGEKALESSFERFLRYRIEIEVTPKTGILRLAGEYLAALNEEAKPKKQQPFLLLEYRDNAPIRRYMEGQRPTILKRSPEHSLISLRYNPFYHRHIVAIREELANWFFFYFDPKERMRMSTPVQEVRHIGFRGEDLDAFLNTLRSLDEQQFRATEKALHLILPAFTGINVKLNDLGKIEFNLLQDQKLIPVDVLSEGTLHILGLLAIASMKESPGLIGIEEPDNSIHPDRLDLIARILETRAWNNEQVIATTHSPRLVDIIPQESLYVCRMIRGRTVIDPFSTWQYPPTNTDEEISQLPELTVSERILRGDFNADY